jgi:chorismate mutase
MILFPILVKCEIYKPEQLANAQKRIGKTYPVIKKDIEKFLNRLKKEYPYEQELIQQLAEVVENSKRVDISKEVNKAKIHLKKEEYIEAQPPEEEIIKKLKSLIYKNNLDSSTKNSSENNENKLNWFEQENNENETKNNNENITENTKENSNSIDSQHWRNLQERGAQNYWNPKTEKATIDSKEIFGETSSEWAKLPPKLLDMFIEGKLESIPFEYREYVKKYYIKLAVKIEKY